MMTKNYTLQCMPMPSSIVHRRNENPLLRPHRRHGWESRATFHGSIAPWHNEYIMTYRAISRHPHTFRGERITSHIGATCSRDGIHFSKRHLLFGPSASWNAAGCEDPRITFFENKLYIFYTALRHFPPTPTDVTVGVAVSHNGKQWQQHHVTPFNAKAMALFPERIGGCVYIIFSPHTDVKPTWIGVAKASEPSDFWNPEFWRSWWKHRKQWHILSPRTTRDQIEVGASPLRTEYGWLCLYADMPRLHTGNGIFTISAFLLDDQNPKKIIGALRHPLLVAHAPYEKKGIIPGVVFPSGAIVIDDIVRLYYTACDTTLCAADISLSKLLRRFRRT